MSKLPIPEKALADCGAVLGRRGAGKSLEDEFGITLTDELMDGIVTAGDAAAIVDGLLSEKRAA